MRPLHVALLLLIISAVAGWQVTVIPESAMQMAVGASLVPAVVAGLLGCVAVLYGVSALRGRQVDDSEQPDQTPLPGSGARLLFLLGGGALFMTLVPFLGFVVPAALCGMGVARAFDAPLGLRSALICGAIAATFWFVFARVLGVGLGPALPIGF